MIVLRSIYSLFKLLTKSLFLNRSHIFAENLLLRQQLIILNRSVTKPSVSNQDRFVFVVLSKVYSKWRDALLIIKPETVIRWHRHGFRFYWKWKYSVKRGRKIFIDELKNLILKMAKENPNWSAPRIRAELRLLGFKVAASTIALYIKRRQKPPSQSWLTFLKNHADQIAGIDFFTVATINFKILYCFVVLGHASRKIIHFNVTRNPNQKWSTFN